MYDPPLKAEKEGLAHPLWCSLSLVTLPSKAPALPPRKNVPSLTSLSFQQDEATANIMDSARSFLKSLGSSYIYQLQWRNMWAFVVQRINNEKFVYTEGFQHSLNWDEWAPPVSIHTIVPFRTEMIVQCKWEDNEVNRRRREFCDRFDGYKEICKCE